MADPLPLSASVRMSDDDFPGVLCSLGDRVRLVVNASGSRYRVQFLCDGPDGALWTSPPHACASKLTALRDKLGADFPRLVQACDVWPDAPADCLPDLRSRRLALLGVFEARDVKREDYSRVVRRDGNLRIAVDPDGVRYRLQWISFADYEADACDHWHTQFMALAVTDLRQFIHSRVYDPDNGGWWNPDVSFKSALSDRLCSGLPEYCRDGRWPALPVIP